MKISVIDLSFHNLTAANDFSKPSDMMSGRNNMPLDIYENLSDINFYGFFKTFSKHQLLLRNISPLVYKNQIYVVRY